MLCRHKYVLSKVIAQVVSKVVFTDMKDSYPMDEDLEVNYTLPPSIQPGLVDRGHSQGQDGEPPKGEQRY